MKKRKIVYVITKGNWGGAQRYVYDLTTHLPKDEFETVVAMGEGVILDRKLNAAGIRTRRLLELSETRRAGLQTSDIAVFFELLRLFKKECPDIIHLNSSRAAFLGALAARLYALSRIKDKGLRMVFTVHGWPFKEARALPVRIGIWLASYITALAATDVIVLSQEDFRLGMRMPCIKRKLSLIYHGITKSITLPREEARRLLGGERARPETFWIGTIAELTPNKGLGYLVEAVARLPREVVLCLIGEGEERGRLEALAEKFGIGPRVIFSGFRSDAAQYLSAFDLFVLPSLKEGLPYALLEAGICGIPVVASDISGIRDIVSHTTLGVLVPPRESETLSHALARLAKDSARRNALGKKLAEHITRNFASAGMMRKTLALYAVKNPVLKVLDMDTKKKAGDHSYDTHSMKKHKGNPAL